MPGMETLRTRAHGYQKRVRLAAEAFADGRFHFRQRRLHLLLQPLRIALATGVEAGADLGGDGEAWRHRQAEPRHLGEIGALAAEQRVHLRAPFGPLAPEGVNPAGHRSALYPGEIRNACGRSPDAGEQPEPVGPERGVL